MTENEKELLETVRNHDNPEQAMEIALDIILKFLMQLESSRSQSSACLREPA